MIKTIKGFIIGVLITSFVSVLAFSEDGIRSIMVDFDQAKNIVVDKEEIAIPDDMKPFVYNGRTYVSLRLISEALGKPVKWREATGTVYIGDVPDDVQKILVEDPLNSFYMFEENERWKFNEYGAYSFGLENDGVYSPGGGGMSSWQPQSTGLKLKNENKEKYLRCVIEVDILWGGGRADLFGIIIDGKRGDFFVEKPDDSHAEYDVENWHSIRIQPNKYYHLKVVRDYEKFDIFLDDHFIHSTKMMMDNPDYDIEKDFADTTYSVPSTIDATREYCENLKETTIWLIANKFRATENNECYFKNFKLSLLDD